MTFLQLVQELSRLAGMAGENGPPVIDGQKGEYRRAIDFVRIAYEDVCNLHFDWDFLWATDALDVEPGLDVCAAPSDLGIWDAERIFLDGQKMAVIEWADFVPENAQPGTPWKCVIRPDGQLQLFPAPAGSHALSFDYFRRPMPLIASNDEPLVPEAFRRVILGRALILYGNYEDAPDAIRQGAEMYQGYLEQLERHQLSRRQKTHGRQESAPITVIAE